MSVSVTFGIAKSARLPETIVKVEFDLLGFLIKGNRDVMPIGEIVGPITLECDISIVGITAVDVINVVGSDAGILVTDIGSINVLGSGININFGAVALPLGFQDEVDVFVHPVLRSIVGRASRSIPTGSGLSKFQIGTVIKINLPAQITEFPTTKNTFIAARLADIFHKQLDRERSVERRGVQNLKL